MVNYRLFAERFICAAQLFRNVGVKPRQAFDMGFVDNRFRPGIAWRRGARPRCFNLWHDSLWNKRRAVNLAGSVMDCWRRRLMT